MSHPGTWSAPCLWGDVLPMLSVTSSDCVQALVREGFGCRRVRGCSVLHRGLRSVRIHDGEIGPEELRLLLRRAGVPYSTFVDLLR